MAGTIFVNEINGFPLYASRAEKTATGIDLDEAITTLQEKTIEMEPNEVTALINSLAT